MKEMIYNHHDLTILGNWLLLIPYVQKQKGGVLIPETAQNIDVHTVCMISAVGIDVKNKTDLQEGTIVLVPKKKGKLLNYEGFDFKMVQEDDILAIIEP